MDSKNPWQSKTLWLAAATALAPLVYPPAALWLAANPGLFSALVAGGFAALRLVTKDKISIS